MRIMLVISTLRRGGAERVVSIMANYWAGHGHAVVLVTLGPPEGDGYQLRRDVNRVALNCAPTSRGTLRWVINNLRRMRRLRAAVRRCRPDIVISLKTETNLLALLALFKASVPVIVSERTDPSQLRAGIVRNRLRSWLYPRAAVVVVQTEQVRAGMQRALPRARFAVIPNPVPEVDPDAGYVHSPLRARLGLPAGVKLISAMGRLGLEKGFDLLVEAFSRVQAGHLDWHLVIFGEGSERPRLGRLITRLDLNGRVHLPGQVQAARSCLGETDLFVLSSRFEGFPNALLEAMACGLPVVSFDCPSGPAEIIRNGRDGLLVNPEDVQGLAVTLDGLMSDESRRTQFGSNACAVLQRYSVERVMVDWNFLLKTTAVQSNPMARAQREQ